MKNGEPEVWIAHSETDKTQADFIANWLDHVLISVLNDYVDYRLRKRESEQDIVTESISRSDKVLVLLTGQSNPDDLIAQIKRARSMNKQICVLVRGDNDSVPNGLPQTRLAELLSGLPHTYSKGKGVASEILRDLSERPGEPKIWLIHAEADKSHVRVLSDMLDRNFISVQNDYLDYHMGKHQNKTDAMRELISQSEEIFILYNKHCTAADIEEQIKLAQVFDKKITVLVEDDSFLPPAENYEAELAAFISGCPHFYLIERQDFASLIQFIKQKAEKSHVIEDRPRNNSGKYNVFISKKSEDYPYAKRVYDQLLGEGINTFLSEESLPEIGSAEYMKAIDDALEQADHLIVVGSKPEYLLSGWVEAEWRVFINEKRSGRKTGNIISVVTKDLTPEMLPMSLRYYEVVPLTEEGLGRLLKYVKSE